VAFRGFASARQRELIQLEQPDVGANPLFFVSLRPVFFAECLPRLAALLDEPRGLVAGMQEGLEGLLIEAGLGERGGHRYPTDPSICN
jgi:hypothetical protein